MTYSLIALMPMRHESVRIPGKNYRAFGDGRPLYQHTLDKLLACKRIERVVINTDSELIKEQCLDIYPDVIVIDRPSELLGDWVPMNDILLHDVEKIESTFYLQTHSTNPLIGLKTFDDAINIFMEKYPIYDSVFSVTKRQCRYWDELSRPVNHNDNILLKTQDLPPYFEENSCFYIFSGEEFVKTRKRIGNRPYMYITDALEAVDLDEEHDFIIAEKLFEAGYGR